MSSFLHDFGDGQVLSHKHSNGGGIVADTATVDADCFVGPEAVVYGNAVVLNRSKVKDRCRVYGTAFVSDDVVLEDNVEVFGTAEVKNGLFIFEDCKVSISPKAILGFDHPVVITDEHIIVGCHCFSKHDWASKAEAIMRVNGYPTKTTRKIHRIVSLVASLHFNIFSDDDISEYLEQL